MDNIKLLGFVHNGAKIYSFYCPICKGYHAVKTKNNIPVTDSKSLAKNMINDFSCQGFTKNVQVPEQDRSFS